MTPPKLNNRAKESKIMEGHGENNNQYPVGVIYTYDSYGNSDIPLPKFMGIFCDKTAEGTKLTSWVGTNTYNNIITLTWSQEINNW